MGMEESRLSHVDEKGAVRMVDVSSKGPTERTAKARGFIRLESRTIELVRQNALKKGDVVAVAKVAGIMAAKRTSEIIPLCHNIFIENVDVQLEIRDDGIIIEATAVCSSKTGIEMEALTAVSAAALTIWDMCKAVDGSMVIEGIGLVEKRKDPLEHAEVQ